MWPQSLIEEIDFQSFWIRGHWNKESKLFEHWILELRKCIMHGHVWRKAWVSVCSCSGSKVYAGSFSHLCLSSMNNILTFKIQSFDSSRRFSGALCTCKIPDAALLTSLADTHRQCGYCYWKCYALFIWFCTFLVLSLTMLNPRNGPCV